MIFWHLGGTVIIVRYVFRDPDMDLRLLLVGAVLPDLIDKPLGRLLFRDQLDSGRVIGHGLLFSTVVLTAILVLTRRGSNARRSWLPLAVGSLFHLFLDFMWTKPETFLWPALGTDFSPSPSGGLAEAFSRSISDPWVLAGEAVGLAYLIWLWRRAGLSDLGRRRRFLRTGKIGVPIGG